MKLLSLDAAGTLLDVNWDPARFAVDVAGEIGIALDEPHAISLYERLLKTRWVDFRQRNLARDTNVTDAFWRELTHDWLAALEIPTPNLAAYEQLAIRKLYAIDSPVFQPFHDAIPFLRAVSERGIPMIVLSNWDISLHRVLQSHGLTPYFQEVFASLEHGIEKPERGLFQIVEHATGVVGAEILHIGDDAVDDFHGAKAAGWQARLLDRTAGTTLLDFLDEL